MARASKPSPKPTKAAPAAAGGGAWSPGAWLALAAVALVAALLAGGDADAMARLQALPSRLLASVSGDSRALKQPTAVDCGEARAFLTDVMPVRGFHVLCVATTPSDTLMVTAHKDGLLNSSLQVEVAEDSASFQLQVEHALLGMRSPLDEVPTDSIEAKYKQPPAYFTPDGRRLSGLRELKNRVVFLFEGGQFIWPGIRVGHKTTVKDVSGHGDLVLETLSMSPLVFGVDEFLRDDEIDVVLELSLPHLAPSGVTLLDGHENRAATDWRTSTTYFLPSSAHQLVREIDRRTADLTKVPISHQEDVQVLRYEKTQKYDQHLDYFVADSYLNSPGVLKNIEYGYKNRMITVFWYMSDVAKGGHTNFPRAGGLPAPHTNVGCFQGLMVAPKKRKVVVFYSMLPNGEGDPMSLHGGCPVEEGIKYSGNKWVWNKPRRD